MDTMSQYWVVCFTSKTNWSKKKIDNEHAKSSCATPNRYKTLLCTTQVGGAQRRSMVHNIVLHSLVGVIGAIIPSSKSSQRYYWNIMNIYIVPAALTNWGNLCILYLLSLDGAQRRSHTPTHTHWTDSITSTSTADAGGNKHSMIFCTFQYWGAIPGVIAFFKLGHFLSGFQKFLLIWSW